MHAHEWRSIDYGWNGLILLCFEPCTYRAALRSPLFPWVSNLFGSLKLRYANDIINHNVEHEQQWVILTGSDL